MSEIAFLVYEPLKKKRANDSFDGNDNIGALVVKDILERAGHAVGFCAPETAKECRVVLVSLTSTYDVYSFYRHVAKRPEWQPGKRKFKVVVGGFGLQNPYTIRNFADYALFGRADDVVVDLVATALDGKTFAHASVMNLPEITAVEIAQVDKLYDGSIEFRGTKQFEESFIGCQNKCKFCHYTWARKYKGDFNEYQNITLAGWASQEMTWKRMLQIEQKVGRIRTALDGFSERLRYNFGKKIGNTDVVEGIEHLGSFSGNTVAIVYNIANFPTETVADREELYQVMASARPQNRVVVVLHSTPFRPSLATPMQWEPVNLAPVNWNTMGGAPPIHDSERLRVVHSTGNEAPYSHLISVIAERATEKTDKLFHAICLHPKLQTGTSARRVEMITRNFDVGQYVRRYEIGEDGFPAWFLTGYVNNRGIASIARAMRGKYESGL